MDVFEDGLKARWPTVALQTICEINPRRQLKAEIASDSQVSFVPMAAVDARLGEIVGQIERPFEEVRRGYTYLENGDVIFAKITPCMQNGKHAICTSLANGFGFGSTEFHVLRPGPTLSSQWLHYFLRQDDVLRDAERHFTGAVGQQRVPEDYLATLTIPLPALAVQKRLTMDLADQLRAAEAARRAAEDRLTAVGALQIAFLRTAFEADDGRQWRMAKLADIAEIAGGLQKTPVRKPVANHCPYLTVRNVQRGRLDLSHVERFEVSQAELERLRLLKGDILIVEGNGSPDQIGRNAVFDLNETNWIHQNHVIRVRLGNGALCQFVSLFLNSPQGKAQMIDRARSTSGLYTLSVDKVGSLEVPLPSISEQARLVRGLTSRLRVADELGQRCSEDADAIGWLPSALLRGAFGRES